jgi:trans-aconitate methyltransferase
MIKEAESINSEEVMREESSHGRVWNSMHGGYFSSVDTAAPFIAKIAKKINQSKPDTVVDLGGGTGFILDQLSKRCNTEKINLINLDLSLEQLNALLNDQIIPLKSSIASFKRSDLANAGEEILFISRSTLHYAGKEGLLPLLAHIQREMKPGECFIHQTACFAEEKDADLMNLLYQQIGTDKWYPSQKVLQEQLSSSGFEIVEICTAKPLLLDSESLFTRYNVAVSKLSEIIELLAGMPQSERNPIFTVTPNGFDAFLQYKIFKCRAIN